MKKQVAPWVNPIFRWAGSKRKQLGILLSSLPKDFRTYFEPFAGSACLFFAIHPKRAVLADVNRELIRSYQMIKEHPRRVSTLALSLPHSSESYYEIRRAFLTEKDTVLRAAYFVYLNRYCFNGVYRTNRKGQFNVPFGKSTGGIPDVKQFVRCSIALRNASLICSEFQSTLSKVRARDFVYLDPPYSSCKRPTYGEYGYTTSPPVDPPSLKQQLDLIDDRGGYFLLSYNDSVLSRRIFSDYHVRSIDVLRHVAGCAKHRTFEREILVSNYATTY